MSRVRRLCLRAVGEPQVRVHSVSAIFEEKIKAEVKTSAFWQGRKDSNPRPMVLETSTLPTELHPYAPVYYTKLFLVCQVVLEKNSILVKKLTGKNKLEK